MCSLYFRCQLLVVLPVRMCAVTRIGSSVNAYLRCRNDSFAIIYTVKELSFGLGAYFSQASFTDTGIQTYLL
jgi:hypothetical protein